MLRGLGAGALVLSVALLATVASARLGREHEATLPPERDGGGIPGYHHALRPPAELWKALRGPRSIPSGDDHGNDGVSALNTLVFESLAHGDAPAITFRENWLAWCAGLLFDDLARAQAPERIVRGGRGLCHDAVAVLITLAALAWAGLRRPARLRA